MWENILFWGVKLDKICYILQIIQNYNSVKGPYGHWIWKSNNALLAIMYYVRTKYHRPHTACGHNYISQAGPASQPLGYWEITYYSTCLIIKATLPNHCEECFGEAYSQWELKLTSLEGTSRQEIDFSEVVSSPFPLLSVSNHAFYANFIPLVYLTASPYMSLCRFPAVGKCINVWWCWQFGSWHAPSKFHRHECLTIVQRRK